MTINREKGDADNYGAGIGVAEDASLMIYGGTITVNGVSDASAGSGAGIGGFVSTTSGNIGIYGGNVTVGENLNAAGIGGGANGGCKDIIIMGGKTIVNATKGANAAYCIGPASIPAAQGTITISGGATVNNTIYTDTHVGAI